MDSCWGLTVVWAAPADEVVVCRGDRAAGSGEALRGLAASVAPVSSAFQMRAAPDERRGVRTMDHTRTHHRTRTEMEEGASTRIIVCVVGGCFGDDGGLFEGLEQVLHVADRREVEHARLLLACAATPSGVALRECE